LGAIVRPIDGFQVGVSYNTPTTYTMSDVYTGRIATDWNDWPYYTGSGIIQLDQFDYATDELLSDYKLKTPGKLALGASFFFSKQGFISGDAEFVNFGGIQYKSNEDFESDNPWIKSLYRSTTTFRLGGEYRLKDYRFRAGVNRQGDPFDEPQNDVSRVIYGFSVGAGIRKENYYVDVALNHTIGKNSYRPYSVAGNFSPLVTINNSVSTFMVTVGLPFR
jgi:long-subunit fatty acid transport protein